MNCFKALLLLLLCTSLPAVEPVKLTDDGRMKFTPVFVDGDTRLTFVDFENPKVFRLKSMDWKTREVKVVHEAAPAPEFDPAYSIDGNYFSFLRTTGGLQVSLVIRNRKSNEEVVIAPEPGFSGYRTPAIAPDSSQMLFSFANNFGQDIFRIDMKGEGRTALTGTKGINIWPSYSPDGKKIVFTSTRDGNYELYEMKPDGSEIKRLTDSPYQDIRGQYSPDGKQIAFVSHRDGNAEIYLCNADGTSVRRVTNHEERDDYPTWHPDGNHLVYVAERDGSHDLYLLPLKD
ncbi:MAG: hypothetical protein CMJ76_03310 [Planctomycetaceae bacterium]|nr:hypothetical protein [Planctomycetaceae bacterium]